MNLEDLGYNAKLETFRKEHNLDSFDVGRVITEHKERYMVKTQTEEVESEVIGNFRFSAKSRSEFPAVGDWVAISKFDDHKALIHAVFPRKTRIERQAVGKQGEKQIIAANIDFALIVQAIDRDFNINRVERYLTICNESQVAPILILSKIDLITESQLRDLVSKVQQRVKNIPIIPISNETGAGFDWLSPLFEKGKTYCLLGSSGVGKSSLLNNVSGRQKMKTDHISDSTQKGRHVTTHRALFLLENGGILIDNPGMRELGVADSSRGLETTFDTIFKLAHNCKYSDCTHTHEKGCAILEAVEKNEIDPSSYQNYLKLEREKAHFESSVAEKRRKDKDFGKMVKNFKALKKLNKD